MGRTLSVMFDFVAFEHKFLIDFHHVGARFYGCVRASFTRACVHVDI